jgi:hypothetical protein
MLPMLGGDVIGLRDPSGRPKMKERSPAKESQR